jgi:YD repeat-containing protein
VRIARSTSSVVALLLAVGASAARGAHECDGAVYTIWSVPGPGDRQLPCDDAANPYFQHRLTMKLCDPNYDPAGFTDAELLAATGFEYSNFCDEQAGGVFNKCPKGCKPATCRADPEATIQNTVGDPVDVVDGSLQWTQVDVDLGGALRFERHYSSEDVSNASTPQIGQGWEHTLRWKAEYDVSGPPAPPPRVHVTRPQRIQLTFALFEGETEYRTGNDGEGTLVRDADDGEIHFTDGDGTQVDFDAAGNPISIRRPGEPPISVTYEANLTRYTRGARGSRSRSTRLAPTRGRSRR